MECVGVRALTFFSAHGKERSFSMLVRVKSGKLKKRVLTIFPTANQTGFGL